MPTEPTTEVYGRHRSQVVDVYRASGARRGQVVLLHGGFWRMPYGRDLMVDVCADLAANGWQVWNAEYRRLGEGGGWPATFDDVAAVAALAARSRRASEPLVTIGHSAGGHLALWVASRESSVTHAVSQAGVVDLARAAALRLSRGAAGELVGGRRELFELTSPVALVPIGRPQLLVHGADDDVVPLELSTAYHRAASTAGDAVTLAEIPACGHDEHLDPATPAWAAVRDWLESV